mmetsp:Transcript_13321/g.25443  ORF Transcript_13321/g.25443 Transcript_13321/m.25443 type:complete len:424 (-) Transcript_13321:938-2209(-)
MVNDAAQYFARYIHDTWSKRFTEEIKASSSSEGNINNNNGASPVPPTPTSIVLIFISTRDRICYISSGTRIAAILPWWRLEHVVQDMKQDLRKGQTGDALDVAIEELTELLLDGPPSFGDRVNDFFQRFGIVMLFTIFTFVFATWGEFRDQRKGLFFAERRSRMTAAEKEKARSLQKEFCTNMCPICLEPFDLTPGKDTDDDDDRDLPNEGKCTVIQKPKIKRVDSFDIPLVGSDDQPIKMLRCGHIFDNTCWSMWADSGHGNPMICPVCRQDVGRPKRGEPTATTTANQRNNNNAEEGVSNGDNSRGRSESPTNQEQQQQRSSLFTRIVANATAGPSGLANYNSTTPAQQPHAADAQREFGAPFTLLSHPTFRRLRVPTLAGLGLPTFAVVPAAPMAEGVVGEQTPLFAQSSSGNEEEDDDY